MNDERQARIKAINDAVKKQLCYGLLGFCVLTGLVFAFIYPDFAKNDEASVSSGIILSMAIVAALGSPVLLFVSFVRFSWNEPFWDLTHAKCRASPSGVGSDTPSF